MQYLYDVYDKQKNDLICQGKTASQIEQLIGIKSRHVSYYVSRQMNYNKRYLITPTQNTKYTLQDWQREWEEVTVSLLTGKRIRKTERPEAQMDPETIKICEDWDRTRHIVLKKLKRRREINEVADRKKMR